MNRTHVAALAVAAALAVGCSPAVAPVRVAPPPAAQSAAWSDELAESTVRAALQRRGYGADVVDGMVAPVAFDPMRVVARQDGGEIDVVAGPGAWLVATGVGRFWVFESGVVLAAAE